MTHNHHQLHAPTVLGTKQTAQRSLWQRIPKTRGSPGQRGGWLLAGFLLGGLAFVSPIRGAELEPVGGLSPWDVSYGLKLGAGYKDNLLLDNVASEQSAFVRAGLEASVVRLPFDGTQAVLLFSGEHTRFGDGQAVDQESLFIIVAQIKKNLGEEWLAGITSQYLYQDEVFDASTTETNRTTLRAKGHSLRVRPSLRRNLARSFWLEAEFSLERDFLSEPLDDFWVAGAKATLGRDYGQRSNVSLSYDSSRRAYDRRLALDAGGVAMAGRGLEFQQHEVELEDRHYWDAARRWRTATRLGFSSNRDNGGGFFDYRRFYCSEQLRFAKGPWETHAQARFSFYDYSTQTVSPADPSTRRKGVLQLELRSAWEFARHWKFYGSFEHERSLSNLSLDEYRVNTISTGVEWEF